MKLQQAFKMAFRSILGNKGRSILTMLGIIIGIASVMTIVSTVNGMNRQTLEMFQKMGTNIVTVSAYRNDGQDVFQDLYDFCLSMGDYVQGITPTAYCNATVVYGTKSSAKMGGGGGGMIGGGMVSVTMDGGGGGGQGSTEQPPNLYFGSDQYGICNNFQIEKGRELSLIDIKNYAQVCVLGARAAQTFFNYADPVGKVMQVNGLPFTVVGVYQEKDPDNEMWSMDNIIVFPYTTKRVISPNTQISEFSVKAKDADTALEASSRLTGYLIGMMGQNYEKGWYGVNNQNQNQDYVNESTKMMSLVLGGIAAISLLVGGIGIMNIMLVTVTERTREIGIRRAIGAERGSIVTQFLIEAAMICGVGGIFGIILGTMATLVAGKFLLKGIIWPSVGITMAALGLSVALGILFGIYPAMKAARLQPVEALRAE